MAFASISSSCLRQRTGMRLGQKLSPRWPFAPSFMFSSTVSRPSALVSWKVRTWPMRATLNAGTPESDLPSKIQVPASGLSKPVSRLNSVVLPAPFGPISAVMASARDLDVVDVDGGQAAERAAHAVGDDDRVDLRDAGRGPRRRAGRSSSARRSAEPVGVVGVSLDKGQLLLVAEDALRPEDHQQHQRDADEDEAQRAAWICDMNGRMPGRRRARAAGCRGTSAAPRRSREPSSGPKTVAAPPSSRAVQTKNVSDVT